MLATVESFPVNDYIVHNASIEIVRVAREWLLLGGSLLVVAALYSHYVGGHSAYLVELIFVLVGASLALVSLRVGTHEERTDQEGLLADLLTRFMTKEQFATVLPLAGFVLILGWSAWKLFVVGETNLRMTDLIVTLFGLSLVLYYVGPSRFTVQKDFVVLYLLFLTLVFVVIWGSYTLITGESYGRLTAYAEYYFITQPVVFLTNLLGVQTHAELNTGGFGLSNIIEYEYHGRLLRLGIGSGCSGLYSAGLFFSAFLAFVLVRYKKVNIGILVALAVGFGLTWASNILRMVITVLVGSAYGHPALAFVHSYLGILIFIAFVTLFWVIIVRWLDRAESKTKRPAQQNVVPTE